MRRRVALLLVAVVAIGGCSAQAINSPVADRTPIPTPLVTQTAAAAAITAAAITSAPITPVPTAEPPAGLTGQAGVTEAMTAPGSLGLTLAEFVSRWNTVLDQGQYPLKGSATRDGATFMFTPKGATNTMLLGVLNDDGTIRAVDALSVAEGITDDLDRGMAQLEALTIWSTLGRAANPRLTGAEGNMVLTDLGITGTEQFGSVAPLVLDLKGVRYYVIEGDTTTNLVVCASD